VIKEKNTLNYAHLFCTFSYRRQSTLIFVIEGSSFMSRGGTRRVCTVAKFQFCFCFLSAWSLWRMPRHCWTDQL